MLQTPGATSFIGCIGKDKFGEEMKKNSKLAGLNVNFLLYICLYISTPLKNLALIPKSDNAPKIRFTTTRMKLHQLVLVPYVLLVVRGQLLHCFFVDFIVFNITYDLLTMTQVLFNLFDSNTMWNAST